jgi:hypothetical protein
MVDTAVQIQAYFHCCLLLPSSVPFCNYYQLRLPLYDRVTKQYPVMHMGLVSTEHDADHIVFDLPEK